MRMFLLLINLFTGFSVRAHEGGYLFATFKGEQTPLSEQIYFVTSRDGRQWQSLNDAKPVLVSDLGERGVRDPYLIRAPDGKTFHLIATDLSINRNGDWSRAVRAGSKSIVIWDSTNLVTWSLPRLVQVAPDDAGCTWAPEAVYDEARKEYLVFWASMTARDDFKKHRIWAAWTRDFLTFGKPFIYLEKPWTLIDTTIVSEHGHYYRFSKDEQYKAITMEVSTNLMTGWMDVTNFTLAKLKGYEGPECYQIKPAAPGKPATWCLILDQYSKGTGYQPFVTEDLSSGQFKPGQGFVFPFRLRHGSPLPISAAELDGLEKAYGVGK
jgi:hypothetical protein